MKVLLVKPPIRSCMVEIGRHMPVGLAYLAAVLRRDGHDVEIFDALSYVEDNHVVAVDDYTAADRLKVARHPRWSRLIHWGAGWQRIEEALVAARPDVVGISCMFTPYYEPAYELARLAKRVVPDAWTVLGGQHATVATDHALTEPAFDVVALGEAEASITPLVTAIGDGTSLERVPGVAFHCAPGRCACGTPRAEPHHTPRAAWIDDLDALPAPAVDLLDMRRYDDTATLITSRGCPFSCSFCTVHATVGREFRARSPESVVAEVVHYVTEHGVTRFSIEDDNFTFDIARVHAICHALRDAGVQVELSLPNGITVVKLDDELVGDMVDAGFKSLFLGLETTDVVRLRAIQKGFTSLERVRDGASLFGRRGLDIGASLIVGLLGQDAGEAARDSLNVARAGVRFWTNPFYPIPGSPDFAHCRRLGLITPETELALYDQFNFAIGSDCLPPGELYWTWVHTQAIAQWPAFVLEADPAVTAASDEDAIAAALRDLVAASAGLLGAPLEVPALPVAFDGLDVTVHEDGCFCSMQRVREGREPGLCTFTGDVLAAAVGLRAGRDVGATQVARAGERCVFRLSPHSPDGGRARAIFAAELWGAGVGAPA